MSRPVKHARAKDKWAKLVERRIVAHVMRYGRVESVVLIKEIASLVRRAVKAERIACAWIADNPYGDEVQACGSDEPSAVGEKIKKAILARSSRGEPSHRPKDSLGGRRGK